jgi:hypothetical protein
VSGKTLVALQQIKILSFYRVSERLSVSEYPHTQADDYYVRAANALERWKGSG